MTSQAVQKLNRAFLEQYPEEVARHLETRSGSDVISFLKKQDVQHLMTLLHRLTPSMAASAFAALDKATFVAVLAGMDLHRVALLLSQMDETERSKRLSWLDAQTAQELTQLLSYTADTAGYYMDTRVVTLHPQATVKDAMKRMRQLQRKRILDLFLVDDTGHLTGVVPLQDAILAKHDEVLQSLVVRPPVTIQAVSSRDEAVELFERGRLSTLPVLDYDNRLLGVIRQHAIMQAAEQEASADIQAMVGVSKEERAFSKASFAIKKRLPWLHINLLTAFLASAVVGLFEGTIAKYTALAVLMPVVAGQSGNTGAQALAVIMRGLALREVRLRQWPKALWKEGRVALINGIAIAIVTAIAVFLWSHSYGLSLIIGLAMVISMLAAGLAGASIPLVLSAFGQDPATSSSIILTTVTDVVGFFSFLGLATLLGSLI